VLLLLLLLLLPYLSLVFILVGHENSSYGRIGEGAPEMLKISNLFLWRNFISGLEKSS